jgi:poly-gamma-glutamate capsule biosynthesis protein CapA/YwtB (metallophosphatase superfamily)
MLVSAVGDIHVNRPNPLGVFSPVADVLSRSDVVFGNSEAVYGPNLETADGPIRSDPSNLAAVAAAGFSVLSLANNVMLTGDLEDLGRSLDLLDDAGVHVAGAGRTLGVLAYTCVGPGGSAVTVSEITARQAFQSERLPIAMLAPGSKASRDLATAQISAARSNVDCLLVTFHWGIHLVPADVAGYERDLARAAVDAGADVVFGHHQHIPKGVDFYRGRPIVHGAGNFVMDLDMSDIAERMPAFAGLAADPRLDEYMVRHRPSHPSYPFHPESRWTAIFQFQAGPDGASGPAFVPCLIDPRGRPVPLQPGGDAFEGWVAYMVGITAAAGLNATFVVQPDGRVGIEPGG